MAALCLRRASTPAIGGPVLCNIADADFLARAGRQTLAKDYLSGRPMSAARGYIDAGDGHMDPKWRDIGMLNGDDPTSDEVTRQADDQRRCPVLQEPYQRHCGGRRHPRQVRPDALPFLSIRQPECLCAQNVNRYFGPGNKRLGQDPKSCEDALKVMRKAFPPWRPPLHYTRKPRSKQPDARL